MKMTALICMFICLATIASLMHPENSRVPVVATHERDHFRGAPFQNAVDDSRSAGTRTALGL